MFELLSELVPESIESLITDEIEEAALIPLQHAKESTAASKDFVFQDDPLDDLIRIYLLLRVSMTREFHNIVNSDLVAAGNGLHLRNCQRLLGTGIRWLTTSRVCRMAYKCCLRGY